MKISFTKTSNTHHEMRVERADGSVEQMSCETRSYLDHDLIHLAVEAEAGLEDGFWGSLASGMLLGDLNDREGKRLTEHESKALGFAETLVGVMTGVSKSADAEVAVVRARDYLQQLSVEVPEYLTPQFAHAVGERLRRLRGHWRATRFGEAMEIEWPDGVPR